MSIGDFQESLSQAMLVGTMLVGRLGVPCVGLDVWLRTDHRSQRRSLVCALCLQYNSPTRVSTGTLSYHVATCGDLSRLRGIHFCERAADFKCFGSEPQISLTGAESAPRPASGSPSQKTAGIAAPSFNAQALCYSTLLRQFQASSERWRRLSRTTTSAARR